jgi:hypothetical protein
MAVTTSNSPGSNGGAMERRLSRKASNQSLVAVREGLSKPVRVEGFSAGMVKSGSNAGSTGSKLISGFSIRKKGPVVDDGKTTAMDMLRRFEKGG